MIGTPKELAPDAGRDSYSYDLNDKKSQDFDRFFAPKSEDFTTTQARELFDWYTGFKPDFPKRRDFDIIQHWGLAPYLYLIEREENGNFRYRLNGEQVVEILGHNQRGLSLENDEGLPNNAALKDYLDKLANERTIARSTGDLSLLNRSFIKFESFDCPLVDDLGKITHIIGVICLIK